MSFVNLLSSRGEAYVKEIRGLDSSIKKLNSEKNKLQARKKELEGYLYEYMRSRNLEEVDGITIKKVKPKPPTIKKKAKEKKEETLELYRNIGIPDPDEFYSQVEKIRKPQKMVDDEEDEE